MKAILRWAFGTNAAMDTPEARREADVAVGGSLHKGEDPIARASRKIKTMQDASAKMDEALPPRSVEEALHQMFPPRRGQ